MNPWRKALLGSTVLLGAVAFAGAAQADVFVTATITKDKDKFVHEEIQKFKFVVLDVVIERELGEAAESEAIVNQRNERNEVDQDPGFVVTSVELLADMTDSVSGNTGETQVNQDVGNMVNQANVLAIAAAVASDAPKFVEAQASVEQTTNNNTVEADFTNITALIDGSINDNVGVTQVNQNGGNMNNQGNAISAAVGAEPTVVALSEADLGQFVTNSSVVDAREGTVNRTATISDSINGNSGVTQVNQAIGNVGNQANVVSLAASGF